MGAMVFSISPRAAGASLVVLASVLGFVGLGCVGDEGFNARFAPDFRPSQATISVFGVFRDGRMSPDAWDDISPRLSAALGQKACPAGYGDNLREADPELFAKVDDYARENGMTDELLAHFETAAEGDLIMVLQMYGHAKSKTEPKGEGDPAKPVPKQARGGGMRNPGNSPSIPKRVEWSGLELGATLFSVHDHHGVAEMSMKYSGTSLDEAVVKFGEKLHAAIPGATCRGWRYPTAPTDEAPQ